MMEPAQNKGAKNRPVPVSEFSTAIHARTGAPVVVWGHNSQIHFDRFGRVIEHDVTPYDQRAHVMALRIVLKAAEYARAEASRGIFGAIKTATRQRFVKRVAELANTFAAADT